MREKIPLAIRPDSIDIRPPILTFDGYYTDIFEVDEKSKVVYHRAVYKIAFFLAKEFHWNIMYGWDNKDDPEKHTAFIFIHPEAAFSRGFKVPVIGAACFRWREYVDHDHTWILNWIWLHPYFRRKGILQKHWNFFHEKFGDFHFEYPYSNAMKNFLVKNDCIKRASALHNAIIRNEVFP